jgi:hypothetical protein
MRLKIKLPNHPEPNYTACTPVGDYRIVYSQSPAVNGVGSYAIRAVGGLRIDMTAYYPMPVLEAHMASGIELFCPGRRAEVDAIVEAMLKDGIATPATEAARSLR